MKDYIVVRLPAWDRWQGAALRDVRDKRAARGTPDDRPYAMSFFSVSSAFDDSFSRFAELVGGAGAETYLLRLLQHVALHAALSGEFRIARSAFGPAVLSRPWHVVSASRGRAVLDALQASGVVSVTEDGGDGCRRHVGDTSATRRHRVGDVSPTDEKRLDVDVKGSESKAALDVIAPSAAVVSPEAQATAAPPPTSPCRCADGLLEDGSFCRTCQPGKNRLRAWKRVRDAERESEARAARGAARGDSGGPVRATFGLPPRESA